MRRREFIMLLCSAATWPLEAWAQQPSMPVIGFLSSLSRNDLGLVGFLQGLNGTGFMLWRFRRSRSCELSCIEAGCLP
jgi:hypothetical protein